MNDPHQTQWREPGAPASPTAVEQARVPSPWGVAFHEARLLVLFVALIATTYMIFAVDAPNLAYKRRVPGGDTTKVETPQGAVVDSPLVSLPPDTPVVVNPADTLPKVDTVGSATLAAAADSARRANDKRYRDSVEKARRVQSTIDSTARALEVSATQSRLEKLFVDNAEINTETAKKIFDMKQLGAIWLDARPEHEFDEGHIPGARNFYAEQWRSRIPELLPLSREKIVVYCGGGECTLSHELAEGLRAIGFKRVVVYTGGTAEWSAKKYPLVK